MRISDWSSDVCSSDLERGEQALASLGKLKDELGGLITKVQGTGLLFSCELDPGFKGYGTGSSEEWLREQGLGVIHGGENSLRFTPRFEADRKSTRLNSSHYCASRMPSSA